MRPSSTPIDAAILWLLLLIGVTGFLVEGLRIAFSFPPFEQHVSFVAWILARGMAGLGLEGEAVRPWHLGLWWVHMVAVFGFLAIIPYTKLLHVAVAPLNIALAPEPRSGRLQPVSLEEVEETGRVGVAEVGDFTRRQLLSFDACTQCRRVKSRPPRPHRRARFLRLPPGSPAAKASNAAAWRRSVSINLVYGMIARSNA